MALFDDLHEGSFRGARFLITDATTRGGRKQVKHEYPNSDKQSIEDLGFMPRSFDISAIITGPTASDPRTYLQKRDELLQALEEGGVGTLSHPFFSSSIQVVARPYTINEKISELGVARIQMEFDFSDERTNPLPQTNALPQINRSSQQVQDQLAQDLADEWTISNLINATAGQERLEDFQSFTENVSGTYNQAADEASTFAANLADFGEDINSLVRDSSGLSDSVFQIIEGVGALYQSSEDTFRVARKFFTFGDGFTDIPDTTPSRIERASNQNALKNAVQGAFLAQSYQLAAEIEYTSVSDVEAVQRTLESQYQKMRVDGSMSADAREVLATLRGQVNTFLREQRIDAAEFVTVRTAELPASVIAYQYYGDVDNLQELTDILVSQNEPDTNNSAFVSGEIEILSK